MDVAGFNWALVKILGVVVLVLALAYAIWRNRTGKRPPGDTDAATRRVYEEEDREHRGESDNVI